MTNENSLNNKSKKNTISVFFIILFISFCVYKILPKIDTSWVIDEAISKVKSEVYNDWGEIPSANGNIVYNNAQDYIVIVKYNLPDTNVKRSCACHIYGYRKGNVTTFHMTKDMSYDFKYNIEELKVMWEIK